MHREGPEGREVHLDKNESRAGSTPGIARWVLLISTGLAVAALGVILIIGAVTEGDIEEEATVSGRISPMETDRRDIDGVVGVEVYEGGEDRQLDPADAELVPEVDDAAEPSR